MGWTVAVAAGLVKENWAAPVGAGFGPVHAPIPAPAALGLLALGGLVMARRRR